MVANSSTRRGSPTRLGRISRGSLKLSVDAQAFERLALRFRKEWGTAQSGVMVGARSRVTLESLRERAYKLISDIVTAERQDIFDELIDYYGCRGNSSGLGEQYLKKGLRALFPGREIDRRRRLEWGNEFEYAYGHSVSPEMLSAFIRGAGSRLVIQKSSSKATSNLVFSLGIT
ncbi:hypothetical protein ACFSTI_06525 [Rhizorhabdus histidinilytica]